MTWKEFKDEIDRQMLQKELSEDMEIEYIDVSRPCKDHPSCEPEVYHNRDSIAIH